MFDAADQAPTLIAEAFLDSVFVTPVSVENPVSEGFIKIFPTLSADGYVHVRPVANVQIRLIQVWDSVGRLVLNKPFSSSNMPIQLPPQSGVYYVMVETTKGRVVEKVVRQ